MCRFDLEDEKIFLETDLFYAECEIRFAMAGADGRPVKQCRRGPRGCGIGPLSVGDRAGVRSGALAQEKMKGT